MIFAGLDAEDLSEAFDSSNLGAYSSVAECNAGQFILVCCLLYKTRAVLVANNFFYVDSLRDKQLLSSDSMYKA